MVTVKDNGVAHHGEPHPAGERRNASPHRRRSSIAASATDADGTVAKVEFFNGSTKLGEDTTAPYTYDWTGVAAGSYTLTARATDNLGATTTSAARTITVISANTPPTANITVTGQRRDVRLAPDHHHQRDGD